MAVAEAVAREARVDGVDGAELTVTRLFTAPYQRWTYQDAAAALNTLLPKNYATRRRYAVAQEHFSADEWVGPGDASTNDKIEKQFAPDDACSEVLWNIANAFREAQLAFAPLVKIPVDQETPREIQSKIEEATDLMTNLWERLHVQELVQNRLYTSAWAGFAGLRPLISGRLMTRAGDEVGFATAEDMATAFDYIHLHAPSPASGAIYTDPNTQDKVSIFFSAENVIEGGEVKERKYVELVYLDPNRDRDRDADTVMRIVYEDAQIRGYETRLQLGGRLLATQMRARALFTDAVLRSQRQLNLLTSLVTRMAETAAFRGRYTLNAKPLGRRVPYHEGDILPIGAFREEDDLDGSQWIVIPVPRTLGADTTTELVGLDQYNQEGTKSTNATPGVVLEDPVDPTPYINAGESVRRRIMRMCSQGHLAGTSNFEVSGIAYEQSRAVYEKDLNARRVNEEGMLRELFTNILALAEWIADRPGYFTDYIRVVINQHVDAGPRSPDSVRIDLESYVAGLLSKATTMSKLGVEDLTAEMELVKASPEYILGVVEKAVTAMGEFDEEGLKELLRILKLPQSFIDLVKKEEEPAPEPTPPISA